jgi:histidinol phosphatase-like enzyme (inositol monophosphatase family)
MDAALIAFAEKLAAAARRETLGRWASNYVVEDKGHGAFDPVTEADRQAERAMRALIRERFPDHGVSGEEWADEPGSSRWSWSLDPIDGTRSFMCGLPTWTTLIALLDEGSPVLGLIDAPVVNETYIGFAGEARLLRKGERTPLSAKTCARLSDARLSTTDPFLLDEPAAFDRIRRAARVTRYGHDGYAYARLAAGSLDLVIESGLKPHDYNALIPVVAGAGGHIGDWTGGLDFSAGRVIAAATRELYEEAAELLSA